MRSDEFRRWIGASLCSLLLIVSSSPCLANDNQYLEEMSPTNGLAALAKRISPAVVGIRGWGVPSEARVFDPEAGIPEPPQLREWQGSGVIVDALAGLIVTANHLVASATTVRAFLGDGRALDAVVLVRSARDDVALLRVEPDNLRAVTLEYPGTPDVGEPVIAIGNPQDWGQSVTFGVVSALHLSCPGIANTDLIQSDVRISQGSSGGALLNPRGRLIGIVVARRSGFAFAVPVVAVQRLFIAAQ